MSENFENFIFTFVKKNRINKSAFLTYSVLISLTFYFLLLSIFGEKGLIKLREIRQKTSIIESQKIEIENKINAKKKMVEGMNLESLDLDLVDEQSRKVLGYVGKNEKVIFKDESEAKP